MIFEIELEGTVWNSAVIDSADLYELSPLLTSAQTSHDKIYLYLIENSDDLAINIL